ncbi:MAG: hypothetical protein GY940_03500 [bacterium]|nr:hypothetical protein [bacterium]
MNFKSYFKKVALVLTVAMLIPGLTLLADSVESKVKKGAEVQHVNGTLVEWSSLPKISLDQLNAKRRLKPIMNFRNPRKLVKPPDSVDPVAQTTFTGKSGLTRDMKALGTPIASFDGMNQSANGAGWPPDTNGDVGPTYYIQTVNTSIGIYNKSTGALVSATTFDAFFPSAVGNPCNNDNNGDPIVLYDQYNERWFILDFAWYSSETQGSHYSIAASKTSDPTGAWWTYCFQADSTYMDDYPKCGVWHDGIYITANMFNFSSSAFVHCKIWALKTPDLYTGTLTSQSTTDSGSKAWSILPTDAQGPTSPSSSAPNYMYAMDASEFGGGATDALYVWKYNVDWTTPANTTWTGPTGMTTATFGLVGTGVPQTGSSTSLDTLAGRLMYSAVYRKFTSHESVYLTHVAETSSRRAMRWYEIRISGGNSSIYQQGTYSPDSTHRWMGSISADKDGNIALGYSAGSSSMHPAIRYAGRLSTDTLGTLGQGEQTLIAGTGSQTSYSRWGDYSMLTIDPDDDETFWYTTEYLTSNGTNWKTRIGSFKITGGGGGSGTDLGEAVDDTSLSFTNGGNADWSKVSSPAYSGGDSAQSGTITHNQTSSMETTVNFGSAKDLKFYWQVSSEANYDYLRFYIDNVEQDSIAGTTSWAQKTYSLTSGSHTLKWVYDKDASVSSGTDAGWVDKVEFVTPTPSTDPLAEAVDDTSLTFTTSGNGTWASQTTTTHTGGDAAQSPTITHNQSASMETTVSGFTSVKFHWQVSSESGYDYLRFYIDGSLQDSISGTGGGWVQKSYSVSSGSHTLKWTYDKDGSVSSGSDAGWVDNLILGVSSGDALGAAVDAPNQSFTLSGDEDWFVTTGDSQTGSSSVTVPAAVGHNETATMETNISGVTSVKFYWKVSSEATYDFLRFYIDGVLQNSISGTVAWTQKSYTVSSGSHTLKWTYDKDGSVSTGSDAGWVDNLDLQ